MANYQVFHGRNNNGFALVATLSLMVLIVMLLVAMMSLSTIQTRSGQNGKAEAEANARLALMMAIGELQVELGPDKRISAQAEILDDIPETDDADDVVHPYYLGIWESWDTWLTDKKDSLTIQDTYKRGRDRTLFRKCLVSHPDASDIETAINGVPTNEMVVLCGEGSAGPNTANHVKDSRVSVLKDNIQTGSKKCVVTFFVRA